MLDIFGGLDKNPIYIWITIYHVDVNYSVDVLNEADVALNSSRCLITIVMIDSFNKQYVIMV